VAKCSCYCWYHGTSTGSRTGSIIFVTGSSTPGFVGRTRNVSLPTHLLFLQRSIAIAHTGSAVGGSTRGRATLQREAQYESFAINSQSALFVRTVYQVQRPFRCCHEALLQLMISCRSGHLQCCKESACSRTAATTAGSTCSTLSSFPPVLSVTLKSGALAPSSFP
jgi:hypothetical protein